MFRLPIIVEFGLAELLVRLTTRRNWVESQPYFYLNRPAFVLQFLPFLLRYNALLPDCRHQQNQSFPGHQSLGNVTTTLVPYEPLQNRPMNRRADDTFLTPLPQFWLIFYMLCLRTFPIHSSRTKHDDEPVLIHRAHRVAHAIQLPTLNNRYKQTSSALRCLF